MDELKGRISSLKEKTREDQIKRQSIISTRTPSPFTAAEIWYQTTDAYQSPALSTDAGIGWSPNQSPVTSKTPTGMDGFQGRQKAESSRSPNSSQSAVQPGPEAPTEYAESRYEDAEEDIIEAAAGLGINEEPDARTAEPLNLREEEEAELEDGEEAISNEMDDKDEMGEPGSDDTIDEGYDDQSVDGQSEYFDSQPVAERHEDRPDAFDYEHFFLHSAMGSFTRAQKRGSMSSEDSIETTKPISDFKPPAENPRLDGTEPDERSPGLHRRSQSVDSISTLATFKTATEGHGSDSGSDNGDNPLDAVTQQLLQNSASTLPNGISSPTKTPRLDSGFQVIRKPEDPSATRPAPAVPKALTSSAGIVNALLDFDSVAGPGEFPDTDRGLVESVVNSLQQVCLSMQSQPLNTYEKRLWRRRLDAARRVLDGESDATF
jgi:hypothetical protein